MLIDNIWVINLDRSKDRLKNIENNFNKYGVSFKRFSAVEGKALSDDVIERHTTTACRTLLCNYGVIGCAMSHIGVWKKLLQDVNTDYYVVLEDDSTIDGNFSHIINDIEELMREHHIDILNLHCKIKIRGFTHNIFNHKGYTFGKVLFPLQTTGYVISKRGANKLLDVVDKISYHVDFQIAMHNLRHADINYYMCYPYIIREGSDYADTTIGEKNRSIGTGIIHSLGLHSVSWCMNIPAFTIGMKYIISVYLLILLILLLLNNLTIKSMVINIIIFVEILLYMSNNFI